MSSTCGGSGVLELESASAEHKTTPGPKTSDQNTNARTQEDNRTRPQKRKERRREKRKIRKKRKKNTIGSLGGKKSGRKSSRSATFN
jgi:hypothetical protein